jgi:hypothetical protein
MTGMDFANKKIFSGEKFFYSFFDLDFNLMCLVLTSSNLSAMIRVRLYLKRLFRLQRQLARHKFLIIDELGFVPLSRTEEEFPGLVENLSGCIYKKLLGLKI